MSVYLGAEILSKVVDGKLVFIIIDSPTGYEHLPVTFPTFDAAKAYLDQKAKEKGA